MIVITDRPTDADVSVAAVAAAGGRVAATAGWAQWVRAVADHPAAVLLLVEAAGIDGPALTQGLPLLAEAAREAAGRLVVVFALEQLDVVADALLGSGATLLCAPNPAERAAAIVLALAGSDTTVDDPSREAERLARLNEEVARIAETLARLVARDAADEPRTTPPIVGDRNFQVGAQPATTAAIDPADIRRAIRGRRLRDEIFGVAGLFEDPAWDMLLDLFAAELEHRAVSVSSLCIAAAVAPTTALRWIGRLLDNGLLDRRPDPRDRRRAYIALTARASAAMRDYVGAARRAGVAIG
ncbi:MAG: MarR family transcriptional regulator [Pseudomonadota bacterium]